MHSLMATIFLSIKKVFENNQEQISFISFADTELKTGKISDWVVESDKGKFFYVSIGDQADDIEN